MTDDDYDLEVLLELRENERDQAREAYADEIRELERREEYAESMRERLQELQDERREWRETFDERQSTGELDPAEARRFQRYLRGLRDDEDQVGDELERAEEAVREQERRVESAREDLEEAIRELEAVERHRDDWNEERERLERRRDAEEMDEIASRIWREEQS